MKTQIWFGKYEIVRPLGEGAASRVYLARHIILGQERAIKCINRSHASYEQVKQEADMMLHLRSPFIPEVYDIEEDEENLYIIEEYMEGESLLSYMEREQPISEQMVVRLTVQVCELMKYLHTREVPILYLDLKPSNLKIQNGQIKLLDFGSAKCKGRYDQGSVTGTRGFAAPELYSSGELGESADIYGIGMLMYYLMTGRLLKSDSDLPGCRAIQGYSKELIRLAALAVKHKSSERFVSVERLEKALSRINGRKQSLSEGKKSSTTIALAGSEHGVGVTHMAWYLMRDLIRRHRKAVYVECGETNVVSVLSTMCPSGAGGFIRYHGCAMTREEWLEEKELDSYEYRIYDYGSLDRKNVSVFLQADISILILGGRLWERRGVESAVALMNMQAELLGMDWKQKVHCVYNHVTAREYYDMEGVRGVKSKYRMPIEPDIFQGRNPYVRDLAARILE